MRLGEILLIKGLVTQDDLDRAEAIHKNDGTLFGKVLVDIGVITWDDLKGAVQAQDDIAIDWSQDDLELIRALEKLGDATDSLESSVRKQRVGRAILTRNDNAIVDVGDIVAAQDE